MVGQEGVGPSSSNEYIDIKIDPQDLVKETLVFRMRIPSYHYMVYKKYISKIDEKRAILREMIKKAIIEVAKIKNVRPEQPIVVNLNMPVVINKLEAKAESKVDVKIDVSSLLAELDELKEMIYSWHRHGAIPKAAVKTATAKIKSIEKMIKGVN